MTDIVKAIRAGHATGLEIEAADTIEALRAENARLRNETLEEAATIAEQLNGWGNDKGAGGHAIHIAKMIRAMGEKG